MKIQSISGFYNKVYSNNTNNAFSENYNYKLNKLTGDVVSFGSKKYDSSSIVNPTNHCAYCGCKVYNDVQIESIAKEILSSKASRLEGKIRSILEKLEGAKHSEEIALAKRIENENEIKFFRNLLDTASKKSYLRGDLLFEQVYNMSKEESLDVLIKNMQPLLKTVDHVSPQNEGKENLNSEVNLVETCRTCNSKLKNGLSFSEFYSMFPSIKNNMPAEKFQYALNQVLDSSQANVAQRLSASNMLKFIQRLFVQRTEALNYLESIDYRISGAKNGILDSIESCRGEIRDKEAEAADLEGKYTELSADPEFMALLTRIKLNNNIDSENNLLDALRDRRQRTSNSINELRNTKHFQNKKKDELTPKEKEEKIANFLSIIKSLDTQIEKHESRKLELEIELEELDKQYPTIEQMQQKKSSAETIYNAYMSLEKEQANLKEKEALKAELDKEQSDLEERIAQYADKEFDITDYPTELQEDFEKYKSLIEALEFIEQHPNGGNLKVLINQSAKIQMLRELEVLNNSDVVYEYKRAEEKNALQKKQEKIRDQKEEVEKQINNSQKQILHLEQITSRMSQQDALRQINEAADAIRRITEKSNYVKIPQRLSTLKAEIMLLNQTIGDLEIKLNEIDSMYKPET